MPAINSPRMDIKMVNGQKVILPGSFYLITRGPWNPGYLHVDWNSIPGLYNQKSYLRMLVIAKDEWDHLSDPAQLKHYLEPTEDPDDFHRTLGLALCWTPFHDCLEPA